MKRFFACVLCALLLLGFAPAYTAAAEDEASVYNLWINGVAVNTSDKAIYFNDGSVADGKYAFFKAAENKLYLMGELSLSKGCNAKSAAIYYTGEETLTIWVASSTINGDLDYGIYSLNSDVLLMNFKGSLTIGTGVRIGIGTGKGSVIFDTGVIFNMTGRRNFACVGIQSAANIYVKNAVINLDLNNASSTFGRCYGMTAGGYVDFSGGDVTILVGYWDNFAFNYGIAPGTNQPVYFRGGTIRVLAYTGSIIGSGNVYVSDAPKTVYVGSYRYPTGAWDGVSNSLKEYDSFEITFLPTDTITVTTQPKDAAISCGETASLTAAASTKESGSTFTYQWYSCNKEGNNYEAIEGATASAYTTSDTLSPGRHYYFCRLSNSACIDADTTVACVTVSQKLLSPVNIIWQGKQALWDAADNAEKYSVTLYKLSGIGVFEAVGSAVETTGASYDFTEAIEAQGYGSYIVHVKAIGDGTVYLDSDLSAPGAVLVYKEPVYSIALSQTEDYAFTGYLRRQEPDNNALALTLSNTGDEATGALAVSLSGANADSFILTYTEEDLLDIEEGGSVELSVAPKEDLDPGKYTAVLTVGPAEGNTRLLNSITLNLSLQVYAYGDANCDGEVNAADAAAVLRHTVKLTVLTQQGQLNGNVAGDKTVNAADAAAILRYTVKLIKLFPVEET